MKAYTALTGVRRARIGIVTTDRRKDATREAVASVAGACIVVGTHERHEDARACNKGITYILGAPVKVLTFGIGGAFL